MAKLMGPGPVFTFELLTTSRRWQVYAARSLFVAGLLVGLAVVWWANVAGQRLESIRAQAEVGQTFFQALAVTQLALALLAAPAATAGSICLDRSRGTLAHLLVTDLSSAEMILGKLAARLVPVVGTVLCSLPFLALGTLLGGIDPTSVLGVLMVTLGAAVLGCTLALTLSVWGTRLTEVVALTYAVWLIAVLLPPTWFVLRRLGAVPWPLPEWLEAMSPVLLILPPTRPPGASALGDSARYLGLSLALSAVLAVVAAMRLRAVAAREPSTAGRLGRLLFALSRHLPGPSLDANPVLWREWQAKRPTRWGFGLWALYALFAVSCTAMIIWLTASSARNRWVAGSFLNATQVAAGLLMLSISAASSLGEERVRGSLDVLLATPMSTRSILWGKWWGTFRLVPILAILPGVAAIAIAIQHDYWLGPVLIVGLVITYGAALTSLGLALATWVPRLGRAVGFSVAFHVGITVGWVLFIIMVSQRIGGMTGPGLACFSPFMGVMLPSMAMQFNNVNQWPPVARWVTFWILFDATLAVVLFEVVLLTFNRCLGRVDDRSERGGDLTGKPARRVRRVPELAGEHRAPS